MRESLSICKIRCERACWHECLRAATHYIEAVVLLFFLWLFVVVTDCARSTFVRV